MATRTLSQTQIKRMQKGRRRKAHEKAQAEQQAALDRLAEIRRRAEEARKTADEAYAALVKAGGARKASPKVFETFMRADSRLLAYLRAVASAERRLSAR